MTLNELIDEKKSIKDQLTNLNVEVSKLKAVSYTHLTLPTILLV